MYAWGPWSGSHNVVLYQFHPGSPGALHWLQFPGIESHNWHEGCGGGVSADEGTDEGTGVAVGAAVGAYVSVVGA